MAKIKINKNSLPKGFTVRNGKVIKTYAAGGATSSSTLKPVDREAANLEAEKGEVALTDTSGDGVFELYNIGGKRHSEGGTPLNLPDQSFIYSDTRGMLLTKDEMKSLGIEQKKRITPAKAAKQFPLNKYIETLEDETSDKIAVETAEQMINKNKIMLSQIAFIQESKKDFENGLPLAAFPYLMAKGVDPQQFQQKIDQINAEKNPEQQPQQGMAQGMPPQMGPPQGGGMPPQGMMLPQPPTDMQAQGMMVPPPQMADGGACPAYGNPPPSAAMKHAADVNKNYKGPGMKYGGGLMPFQTQGELVDNTRVAKPITPEVLNLSEGDIDYIHKLALARSHDYKTPSVTDEQFLELYRQADRTDLLSPNYSEKTDAYSKRWDLPTEGIQQMSKEEFNDIIGKKQTGGDLMPYQTQGEFVDKDGKVLDRDSLQLYEDMSKLNRPIPNNIDSIMQRTGLQLETQKMRNEVEGDSEIEFDLPTKCKNQLCEYDEWRFAYRLKDIKEVRFMYESYKTKALDKMKAPDTGTTIMPGPYGNMPQMRLGGDLKRFVYGGQDNADISMGRSNEIELDPLSPAYVNNPMYRSLGSQLEMMQQEHSAAIKYHQANPHMFKEKKAQEEFEKQLNSLQGQMRDVELQMRSVQRKDVLAGSIMDLDQFMPNVQIADPSMYTGSNPAMQGAGMMMARQGMELPRMDVGGPICTGDDCNHSNAHDSDKYKGREKGRAAHTEFHNHVMGEDFNEVRAEWINGYKAIIKQWEDVTVNAGGIDVIKEAIRDNKSIGDLTVEDLNRIVKNQPVSGKSDDELFTAYMDMNDKLLQAKHAGYNPIDFKKGGYKKICQEFGWGNCEGDVYKENAKMFQGMFTAMQDLKGTETDLDQADAFFGNITLDLKGGQHSGGQHIDERTGLPMSDIDGIVGMATAGQYSSATNEVFEEEVITEIKCDEAEQKRIAAECLKKGQDFDLDSCSCKTEPETPEDRDIPPYMTFPQDDLRLQNAIGQKWDRNLYMPTRQNVDPVLPDVAYQDPQAMIQANLAMAQQLAKADPANASFYMGQISDKMNKGISDVANTNIKIFDNSEARKSQILNNAMTTNSANRDEYNTRVATALNNFDNTMAADNANIVDVQVDRMDHADKLYGLNMENPNYYYDAQNHMNTFYNPDDLNANQPSEQMTFEAIEAKCKGMNYAAGTTEMLKCIEMYRGQGATSSTPTRSNMHRDESDDSADNTEEVKYGNEVGCTSCNRKQELARSKKALRDWIFGV